MCLLQRSMHSMRFGAVVDVVGVVFSVFGELCSARLCGCWAPDNNDNREKAIPLTVP